ncbi:MAG: hypothetical protein AB7Q27_06680 [Acidimicrobiia bacterium]
MRSRPRGPAVPIAGGGAALTTIFWFTAGTPVGVLTLITTVVVLFLDFLKTIHRDQAVSDLARLALSEHIPLTASSTPTGLEIHVAPDAKENLHA